MMARLRVMVVGGAKVRVTMVCKGLRLLVELCRWGAKVALVFFYIFFLFVYLYVLVRILGGLL